MQLCLAKQILGKSDTNLVISVRKAQRRLRPTKVAWDGSIMEWVSVSLRWFVISDHMVHFLGNESTFLFPT